MFNINTTIVNGLANKIKGLITTHNADTNAHTDKEIKSNKVTSLSSSSTDTQYPSAKAVYDEIQAHSNEGGGSYIDDYYLDSTTKEIVLEYIDGNPGSGGSSGSSITIDESWIAESTNPVESQLIQTALNGKANSTHTHTSSQITDLSIPSASSTTPSADTTNGSVGNGTTWAKADHTHPKSSLYAESSHTHTTSQITDFPTIPSASSTTPSADTTSGSYGSGTSYARSNHTHPKSTLYAEASHTHSAYVNPTICDNLTTNDSTQVLSAKQGKILNDLIGQAITYINQ